MKSRTTAAGLAVAAGSAALIIATASYGLGAGLVVGVAAGAAVALVPAETGLRKIAGLLTGILVGMAGYALRAGILPDSAGGTVVGVTAVLVVLTLISMLTRGRVPLWASLMGLAAIAGAYETLHIVDFAGLFANLPVAAAATLLATAVGFTAAAVFAPGASVPGASDPAEAELPADDASTADAGIADSPAEVTERQPVLA